MNYETLNKFLIKDLKESLDFALKNTNKIVKTSNKMLYGTLIKIPNEDFVNKIVGKFFIELLKMEKNWINLLNYIY